MKRINAYFEPDIRIERGGGQGKAVLIRQKGIGL
jgi:hypothetical protein